MRVLLTRQPAQAGDLEAGLAGAEVAGRRLRVGFLPLTDFALPDDDGPLRALLADWAGADGDAAGPVRSDGSRWLVLTSPNTVRALRAVGWDGHVPAGARIAVTGPGTARVLTEAGCDAAPWLPPEDRSAEGLIAGLAALHPRGARAWLPQSDRARSRLGVEVPDHLHVVRDEAQRHDDEARHGAPLRVRLGALAREVLHRVVDVRLEPRHRGRAGARLVHERPRHVRGLGHAGEDLAGHVEVLRRVHVRTLVARLRPRLRAQVRGEAARAGGGGVGGGDRVGREEHVDPRVVPQLRAQRRQVRAQAVPERLDEAGVVEVLARLVQVHLPGQAGLLHGHAHVLAVLAARGVAGVRGGGDRQDAAVPVGVHPREGVREVGLPVAVAPVHGQVQAAGGQLGLDGRLQRAVLRVDGADAAVGAVVGGDLLEALVRDAAPARDVAQERDHVVLALGPAEGGEQQGVVVLGGHHAAHVVVDAGGGLLGRPEGRGDAGVRAGVDGRVGAGLGGGGHQASTSAISAVSRRRPV